MIRLFVYLLLFGCILYCLWLWGQRSQTAAPSSPEAKPKSRFRKKKNPQEPWVQVYETASMNEARMIQARIQEEEAECVLYEQGKKDIHGNEPKGVGIAVPKSAVNLAQRVISRLPV